MTDNQQVESAAQDDDADSIPFNDAEHEGKELVHRLDSEWRQFRLGELAHRVKPVYGEGTLRKYAEAIGIALCTLDRYRTVYRAWAPILAPGRKLSYAVARALASHPDRAEIIRENPEITKRNAEELARQHRAQNGKSIDANDEDDDEEHDQDEAADNDQAEQDEDDANEDQNEQEEQDQEADDDQADDPPLSMSAWIGRQLVAANRAAGHARFEDWNQFEATLDFCTPWKWRPTLGAG